MRGIRAYQPLHRWLLLAATILSIVLHIYLETPLSGLLLVFLWLVFSFYILLQSDVRRAFSDGVAVEAKDAAQEAAE